MSNDMVARGSPPDHRLVPISPSEGEAMQSLSKPLFAPLLLCIAAFLLVTARPAAAAKLDAPWAGSGTATTKVASDGAAADPEFDYAAKGFSGSWSYSTVGGSTRAVPVKWDYSGFHAWYQVKVSLVRFIQRGGVDIVAESLVNQGPVNCCAAPSGGFAYAGTTTFDVQKGDVYGFRMAGGNFDSNDTLQGALKLHPMDDTAPVVTPAVTGKAAANGYYGGPVSVKWTVQDDDTPISAKT